MLVKLQKFYHILQLYSCKILGTSHNVVTLFSKITIFFLKNLQLFSLYQDFILVKL